MSFVERIRSVPKRKHIAVASIAVLAACSQAEASEAEPAEAVVEKVAMAPPDMVPPGDYIVTDAEGDGPLFVRAYLRPKAGQL